MQGHVCVPRSNPQGRGRQQGSAHSPQTAPSLKELPKPRRTEPGRMFCSLKGGPAPPPTDSSRTEIPPREAPGAPAAAAASPHPQARVGSQAHAQSPPSHAAPHGSRAGCSSDCHGPPQTAGLGAPGPQSLIFPHHHGLTDPRGSLPIQDTP